MDTRALRQKLRDNAVGLIRLTQYFRILAVRNSGVRDHDLVDNLQGARGSAIASSAREARHPGAVSCGRLATLERGRPVDTRAWSLLVNALPLFLKPEANGAGGSSPTVKTFPSKRLDDFNLSGEAFRVAVLFPHRGA